MSGQIDVAFGEEMLAAAWKAFADELPPELAPEDVEALRMAHRAGAGSMVVMFKVLHTQAPNDAALRSAVAKFADAVAAAIKGAVQ